MSARILVTRSEPECRATAQRLSALGYRPIVEPAFGIEAMEAELPAFDALAFTSLNGVRMFAGRSATRDVPVFCVGARTADAARAAGFIDAVSAQGDVAALAALIAARLTAGQRLLHVGNEESRGDLAGRLAAQGLDAGFQAIFRARPFERPGAELARHLAGETRIEAALVHSPRAGAILAGWLAAAPGRAGVSVAAISEAAGDALKPFAERLSIAAAPDEAALFAALAELA